MNNKSRRPEYFRLSDLVIIIVFLLIAVFGIDMFRYDFLRTINLRNVEPVGTVVIKKNTVQRRISDRVLWDRLAGESPVYIGDLIRVAEVSAATLNIEGNSIDLDENTLIRITRAPDGKGLRIVLGEGNLSITSGNRDANISLDINGRQVQIAPETVISAAIGETGGFSVQVNEGNAQIVETDGIVREISSGTAITVNSDGTEQETKAKIITTKRLTVIDGLIPELKSPAFNSLFRYRDKPPVLNFQWTKVQDAVSYIIEINNMYNFSSPKIRKQTSAVSMKVSALEEGSWYWRVMPVFPPVLGGETVFSTASFFRIEQISSAPARTAETVEETDIKQISTAPTQNAQEVSLSQWLTTQAPSKELPPDLPPEIIPPQFIKTPEPSRRAPLPTPPLPSPRNLQPARGTVFDLPYFQKQRSIVFSWSAVQGANAYIFTLFQQTTTGRRQILRQTINNGTSYTFTNLRLLERGNFPWQVEAVNTGRGGAIEHRGTIGESMFIIDFPSSAPLQIGNEEIPNVN